MFARVKTPTPTCYLAQGLMEGCNVIPDLTRPNVLL